LAAALEFATKYDLTQGHVFAPAIAQWTKTRPQLWPDAETECHKCYDEDADAGTDFVHRMLARFEATKIQGVCIVTPAGFEQHLALMGNWFHTEYGSDSDNDSDDEDEPATTKPCMQPGCQELIPSKETVCKFCSKA